jgi:hypothetical protein
MARKLAFFFPLCNYHQQAFSATLYLAQAKAAPKPKITKNTNTANDLFCFISTTSVNNFNPAGSTGYAASITRS